MLKLGLLVSLLVVGCSYGMHPAKQSCNEMQAASGIGMTSRIGDVVSFHGAQYMVTDHHECGTTTTITAQRVLTHLYGVPLKIKQVKRNFIADVDGWFGVDQTREIISLQAKGIAATTLVLVCLGIASAAQF